MRVSAHPAYRAKYRARKTDGYASKKEARRAQELRLLEKAGKIANLQEQVKFDLIPKQDGERACYYVADFTYYTLSDSDGTKDREEFVVEDCKGFKTKDYIIKRKLMRFIHGIKIQEV